MSTFIEKPVNKMSMVKRKLVQGVGINDATYKTKDKDDNGKEIRCPYYLRWVGMIKRCYSARELARRPTYKGCTVCEEWITFTNFKKWMMTQDWEGKTLDKDFLIKGNKVYSPDTCIFISVAINSLFTGSPHERELPVGVKWHKRDRKYAVTCSDGNDKRVSLGYYDCVKEAEAAYCRYKAEVVARIAESDEAVSQPRLKNALLREVKELRDRENVLIS